MRETGVLALCSLLLVACAAREDATVGDSTRVPSKTSSAEKSSAPDSSPTSPAGRKTVLFLGTSLTAGLGLEPDSAYPQQVQRRIDAEALPFQTVNAGVSGETSAGLLRRLEWVLQRPAEVIVVETGANDGLRGQSVAATRATIGQILARIRRERPTARVALMQMEAPTNLGVSYTSAFHEMFPALAREHDATLLPFLLEGVAGRAELNQADGVHPNYDGERIVTENVWRGLEPLLRR